MEQNEHHHPAVILFDNLLQEMRQIVRSELSNLREEIKSELNGTADSTVSKPTSRRFYRIKQAAEELNLSEATVRRLVNRGLLRASKATRHILIPREEIENFVQSTL